MQKKDLKAIDQSAPLQMPTNYKRAAEERAEGAALAKKPRLAAAAAAAAAAAEDADVMMDTSEPSSAPLSGAASVAASTAAAVASIGELKKRLADKLDAPQEKAVINKANLK